MDLVVRDVQSITDYLVEHPGVFTLFIDTLFKAGDIFSGCDNVTIVAEVCEDPETDDSYLTVHVRCSEATSEILKDFDDLQYWVTERLGDVPSGWVQVEPDFTLKELEEE